MVTQAQIAQKAKTDPMMTSQVLRTLEKKELLRRREHPTDSRAKQIELTTEGKRRMNKALKVVEAVDVQFFQCLAKKRGHFLKDMQTLAKDPSSS